MFWATSIFQGFMIVVACTTFHETYAPLILRRRAEHLRSTTSDDRYYTLEERADGKKSVIAILGWALSRPLRLLVFHPIIQLTALLSALYYGILYIVLSTFSDVWTSQYHQSIEISGLHYIACALGEVAGSLLFGPLMDFIYSRMRTRSHTGDGELQPEHRIPFMLPGVLLAPIGLFIYGWTAQYRAPWTAVDIETIQAPQWRRHSSYAV